MRLTIRLKGGTGSGHFGHSGRPGKVGGSIPGVGITVAGVDEALSKVINVEECDTWDVNDAAWISPSGRIFKVSVHKWAASHALESLGMYNTDKENMSMMRGLGYARVIVNEWESDFDVQFPLKRGTKAALTEILELQAIKSLVWIVHGADNEIIDAGSGIANFNRAINM